MGNEKRFYTHQNMFPNLSHQWLHWNSQLPHQNFHPETKWILGPLVKNSPRLPYINNISLVFKQESPSPSFLLGSRTFRIFSGGVFPDTQIPKEFPRLFVRFLAGAAQELQVTCCPGERKNTSCSDLELPS